MGWSEAELRRLRTGLGFSSGFDSVVSVTDPLLSRRVGVDLASGLDSFSASKDALRVLVSGFVSIFSSTSVADDLLLLVILAGALFSASVCEFLLVTIAVGVDECAVVLLLILLDLRRGELTEASLACSSAVGVLRGILRDFSFIHVLK